MWDVTLRFLSRYQCQCNCGKICKLCQRHHPSSDQGWRLNNLGNSIFVVKLPDQELYHYVRTCLRVVSPLWSSTHQIKFGPCVTSRGNPPRLRGCGPDDVLTRARSLRTVVDGGKPAPELEKRGKNGTEKGRESETLACYSRSLASFPGPVACSRAPARSEGRK